LEGRKGGREDQLELHSEFKASLRYIARPCLERKEGREGRRKGSQRGIVEKTPHQNKSSVYS
jgi:hypothetical protein